MYKKGDLYEFTKAKVCNVLCYSYRFAIEIDYYTRYSGFVRYFLSQKHRSQGICEKPKFMWVESRATAIKPVSTYNHIPI